MRTSRHVLKLATLAFMFGSTVLIDSAPPAAADEINCTGPCLLTGGTAGDYYRYFAPMVQNRLRNTKVLIDLPTATSPGAPASLDYLLTHQDSIALIQGDVMAEAQKNPTIASKIKVLYSGGIGNEALIAVISDKLWNMGGTSWSFLTHNATRVHFVTGPENSGPGATLTALRDLDPKGLGRGTVDYYKSLDDALLATAQGTSTDSKVCCVALVVQFGNPQNPRFEWIADHKLHVAPVVMSAMRGLKFIDGKPAYTYCDGVNTGSGVISTACTPIQLVTGIGNTDTDVINAFAGASAADFTPQDSAWGKLWKAVKVRGADALNAASDLADTVADKVANGLK